MRTLIPWLIDACEQAALAAAAERGRGDKEAADQAAVDGMRRALQDAPATITVVIGEGEMDEAPMLYIGEQLGAGGEGVDLAVDPLEGTILTAKNQPGAVAVLAAAPGGTLFGAPDMYMDKIVVGRRGRGAVSLDAPLDANLVALAKALGKDLRELSVVMLDRPRHEEKLQTMRRLGVQVRLITDGDVMPAVMACLDDRGIDAMVGSGGAPEGVLTAVAVAQLGGDMQGRLLPENEEQAARVRKMGHEPGKLLRLEDLVRGEDGVFVGSAVTEAYGLRQAETGSVGVVETLVVERGRSRILRTHVLAQS